MAKQETGLTTRKDKGANTCAAPRRLKISGFRMARGLCNPHLLNFTSIVVSSQCNIGVPYYYVQAEACAKDGYKESEHRMSERSHPKNLVF